MSSVDISTNNGAAEESALSGSNSPADDTSAAGYVSFADCLPVTTPSVVSVCWDDLDSSDTRDLQIKVDDPQKHVTNMETYITFRIATKTCRVDYEYIEFEVRRRYNDFMWLRARLVEAYPTHIVPPLPEKHTLIGQLDRYQREFIRCRMAMLHRFMNRLADHPVLSCNENFKMFITLKPSEFAVQRSRGRWRLGRVSDSLQSLSLGGGASSRPVELQAVVQRVQTLGRLLASFELTAARIHKHRQDSAAGMSAAQPMCLLWAASESEQLAGSIGRLGSAMGRCAEAERQLLGRYAGQLAQPLREYVLYTEAVTEAAGRRDQLQHRYQNASTQIQRKQADRSQVMSGQAPIGVMWMFSRPSPEALKTEENKLGRQIQQLTEERESVSDQLEYANANLMADMERWELQKNKDLSRLLRCMADSQIQYYQQCLEAWESIGTDSSTESSSTAARP